jgi:hypothetical protein
MRSIEHRGSRRRVLSWRLDNGDNDAEHAQSAYNDAAQRSKCGDDKATNGRIAPA